MAQAKARERLSRSIFPLPQNRVRANVNFFAYSSSPRRSGIDEEQRPEAMKWALADVNGAGRLTLLDHRPGRRGDGDLAVSYSGEPLFRLVWVDWPEGDGRWHVRRHPEATWWRARP